jgi:hypothetical protein
MIDPDPRSHLPALQLWLMEVAHVDDAGATFTREFAARLVAAGWWTSASTRSRG